MSSKLSVHGVFLCHKPSGISSTGALSRIKRAFGVKKGGHTGSLDPLATGVLPLCFGEATKFAQFGLESIKCYRVVAQLGSATETGDRDGEVCSQFARPQQVDEALIRKVIFSFVGIQKQTPSQYSAIKYQGKALYEYARKGVSVPVASRDICISKIEIENIDLKSNKFQLWVCCSKGTYIRSLVQDIGEALGWCAHVSSLHRTHAGFFEDKSCEYLDFSLKKLAVSGNCLPVSSLLLSVPWVFAWGPEVQKLDYGHAILSGETESIEAIKHQVWAQFNCSQELNLCLGQDALMQRFNKNQAIKALEGSCESLSQPREFLALFTAKSGFELSPAQVKNFSGLELSRHIRLRGLVKVEAETFQPSRMVATEFEVF